MKDHPRGRLLWILLATAAIAAGLFWGMPNGTRRANLKLVRAWSDPAIDAQRTMAAIFDEHPRLAGARWTPGWSEDDRMVAVAVTCPSFDDLRKAQPALAAPFIKLVALTPRWAGIAGDRPAEIEAVFRVSTGEDGATLVQAASVRLTRAWAVFKPDQVADYEKNLEASIAEAADPGLARRYRLEHDGDRALFDAGLEATTLAGPGMALSAQDAIKTIASWK